jgi:hypothetical protein
VPTGFALLCVVPMVLAQGPGDPSAPSTRLGMDGSAFTLDGKPTFLMGISYYGALGASDTSIQADLDDLRRCGINWVRVWATWGAFENDVSAVDAEGHAREPYLEKLAWLVAECDRRGIVVDVTLSRGNGVTGPPRLGTLEAHARAVETLVKALESHRNWYLDLANERNIRDERFVSVDDLIELRRAVKALDPERLVTASHAGDLTREELREYLIGVRVDFLAVHRPRHAGSPAETEARARECRAWMAELVREVPLHYQEPFRRGFDPDGWEPAAENFLQDLKQAHAGGAAGWCFHNGAQRDQPDERPRRSFDLRDARLFDQLDEEERQVLARLKPTEVAP